MVGPEPAGADRVSRDPLRCRIRVEATRLACLALSLAAFTPAVLAQESPVEGFSDRLLSESARISLVTILPGKKVYSVFGHNAIRVVDPERGIDVAYNYGTFDFGNPLTFSAKFLYGDLNYRLAKQRYDRMVAYYPSEEGRPLIEQWLDLDADQRETIFRFLEWNALPENAYYRYDFFYDNCATRIRDLFEDVLGSDLRAELRNPDRTMRQLLDPYLVEKPLLHLGMDFAQGVPADRPATARDAMFLPDHLASWLAGARLQGPDGERALIAQTDSIGWTPERGTRHPAFPWVELLAGTFLAWVVYLTIRDLRSDRTGRRWLDVPLFGLLGRGGLCSWRSCGSCRCTPLRSRISTSCGSCRRTSAWPGCSCDPAAAGGCPPTCGRRRGSSVVFALGWPFWTQEVSVTLLFLALVSGVRSAGLALGLRGDREETASVA